MMFRFDVTSPRPDTSRTVSDVVVTSEQERAEEKFDFMSLPFFTFNSSMNPANRRLVPAISTDGKIWRLGFRFRHAYQVLYVSISVSVSLLSLSLCGKLSAPGYKRAPEQSMGCQHTRVRSMKPCIDQSINQSVYQSLALSALLAGSWFCLFVDFVWLGLLLLPFFSLCVYISIN